MNEIQFRPISEEEKKMLLKMLELEFPARDIFKKQLEGLLVKQIDDNGSLSLQVVSGIAVPVLSRAVVVEARCPDIDAKEMNDPHINLLLHVAEGKMVQLEIYRDDSKPIIQKPNPDDFQLFSALKK